MFLLYKKKQFENEEKVYFYKRVEKKLKYLLYFLKNYCINVNLHTCTDV